jgi:hypothetical protein
MRSFIICTHQIYWDNQIKKGEMGMVCSMHGGNRKAYKVLIGKTKGKRILEDLCVGGSIVLKRILQN